MWERLQQYASFTVLTQDEFLQRSRTTIDTDIAFCVYNITDPVVVISKLKRFFGDIPFEVFDGYIIIEPVPFFEKKRFNYGDLVEIVKRLRDPDGCPWDRVQTLNSIKTSIIEEAYELTEAIDLDDSAKICEESGDVILQGVFSAIIASDSKGFDEYDVINGLCEKLISRHTHIFGTDRATDPDEALKYWELAKAKEKKQKGVKDKLLSVPFTFSALMRANKVQKIIKKTGFDFPTLEQAVDKIYEETKEFLSAKQIEKEAEAGDMLFSVVNVLRMCDIDPEVALSGTVNRFIDRFNYVIERAEEQGKRVEELTLDEMEVYYQEAKNRSGRA